MISGPVSLEEPAGVKRIDVKTADEMFKKVNENKKDIDLIIMTAAVEDLKPVNSSKTKIKKESVSDRFTMEFEKAIDILKDLGENKNGYKLIGFALETDNGIENAKEKLANKNLDLIVS